MNVYVASRFGAYERTRAFIDAITAAGHKVTHDWTRTDEFVDGHPTGPSNEADILTDVAVMHAEADLLGVFQSDVVVLFHEPACTGALIEAGAAIASGKRLWVIAPCRLSIFWRLEQVDVFEDEAACLAEFGAAA